MAKVRFSQRCAGPCRAWLRVGVQAVHLHGGWWCLSCAAEHRNAHGATCRVLTKV